MDYLENANTVVSLIFGLLSIVMFWLSKIQKDKCVKISNKIDEKIQIINKGSSINSHDVFKMDKVELFDNKKSIN